MKRIICFVIVLLVIDLSLAKSNFFSGGSGHIMANQNIASNVFVGYQATTKTAVVANYYAGNTVSIDLVYNGWVISKGFSTDLKQEKEFLTILQTPKIVDFGKKWKLFVKIGVNAGGPINKIHKPQISTLFGVGVRYN